MAVIVGPLPFGKTFFATNVVFEPPEGRTVGARCPECGQIGTLAPVYEGGNRLPDLRLENNPGTEHFYNTWVGLRLCPFQKCRAILLVFMGQQFDAEVPVLGMYPPQRIDSDAGALPDQVRSALEDAITCHATGCYMASGMMVRKALEALCDHEGAKGDTLSARLKALRNTVVLPEELFEGMDDLKLLGNDAAHVEVRTFAQVGKEEVEVGIAFAKIVVQAVYQYRALREQLSALKLASPGSS